MKHAKLHIFDLTLLIVVMVIVLTSCSGITGNSVKINGERFKVEIADERNEWILGLSHRDSLDLNSGMLFVFPSKDIRSFWMKNTLIPLDIIYIDDEFEIVNIVEAYPCKADPCPSFQSSRPVRYVLEINGGLSSELGFSKHDKVKISI